MRTGNIQVSFTMSVPSDNPNKNGVLLRYEVIQDALSSMMTRLPIRVCTNNGDSMIIGHTTSKPYAIQHNEEENITEFTVDGVIYYGGMECLVNEIDDNNNITDFEIVSFGFGNKTIFVKEGVSWFTENTTL